MTTSESGRPLDWEGGSLDELLGLLGEPALSVRIEALRPGSGQSVGEVHVVAGGISDTLAGERRGDEALAFIRKIPGLRFRVTPALPNADGTLQPMGAEEGELAKRPVTALMRYCEDFVLTCALELARGVENARISYRRGEIIRTLVDGSESPERLPDVIGWSEGTWRIVLPQLNLPRPKKPQRPALGEGGGTLFGIPAPIIRGITPAFGPGSAASAPSPAAASTGPGGVMAPSAPAAPTPRPAPAPATQPTMLEMKPVVAPRAAAPAASVAPAAAPSTSSASSPAAGAASAFASTSDAGSASPSPSPSVSASPSPSVSASTSARPAAASPFAAAPSRASSSSSTGARPAPVSAPAPAPVAASTSAAATVPGPGPARQPIDLTRATPPAVITGPARPSQIRPVPRTFTSLPLVVHVLLGVALGAAVVAGYWAFLRYGAELGLR